MLVVSAFWANAHHEVRRTEEPKNRRTEEPKNREMKGLEDWRPVFDNFRTACCERAA